jgi:hypothetical protein
VWHQLAQHPNDYVYTWAGRVATAWAVQTTTDKQRTNKKRKAKKGKEERRGDEGKEQNFAPGIPGKNAVKKRVQYVSPAAAAAAYSTLGQLDTDFPSRYLYVGHYTHAHSLGFWNCSAGVREAATMKVHDNRNNSAFSAIRCRRY